MLKKITTTAGLLALAAALTGSAIPATASAVEYLLEAGKSFPEMFWSTLIELTDASLFAGELLGIKIEIECKHVELVSGELVSATAFIANIDHLECVVLAPSGCGVHEPIEMHLKGQPVSTTGTMFEPQSGTTLAEIQLTVCMFKGKYKLTGSFVCDLDNGAQQTSHQMVCSASGNALLLGGSPAQYTSQELPLSLQSGATFGQG